MEPAATPHPPDARASAYLERAIAACPPGPLLVALESGGIVDVLEALRQLEAPCPSCQ